ncbi:MAG TPA: NAD(P)-dependent glycerol-1-phosphate dehydrogenase [Candidatus Thermoplasmatota archaeon]|nr:NAD(P)-dependent glycerol-1-phosphate dehydrogenase [Candidatus Thermoplasmatota archaeon]
MPSDEKIKHMVFPRHVLVGTHALDRLGEAIADLELEPEGIVVVDATTRKLVGDRVLKSLAKAGLHGHFYESKGPTRASVKECVRFGKKSGAAWYIGAGGGSVIDVAKLAAFEHGPAFVSVPTSASHDGICSGRASIKETRGSVSLEAKPPAAIIADTAIIAKAPYRMLAAGCADVISNLTAVLDWKLAHRLKDEEYSSFAAVLAKTAAEQILENLPLIRPGLEEAAWVTVKSLVVSGVSMAVAGSSRPASGAEHLLSHALDRLAPGAAMHGEQVGVGTILMMQLHGGDWERVRDALKTIGAPTTAKGLHIPPDRFLKALTTCHRLRPDRYTILGESGLTKDAAGKLCKTTGVL